MLLLFFVSLVLADFYGAQLVSMDYNLKVLRSQACDPIIMNCAYQTYWILINDKDTTYVKIDLNYWIIDSCNITAFGMAANFNISLYDAKNHHIVNPITCNTINDCVSLICQYANKFGIDKMSLVSLAG